MVFLVWRAFRNCGKTPGDAWNCLLANLVVGGDDMRVTGLPKAKLDLAAKQVGQELTYEPDVNGQFEFFARWYCPGDVNSCANPQRALAHLVVTTRNTMDPLQVLQEKLSSLARTDRNTPLIKEVIDTFLKLGGKLIAEPDGWWARHPDDQQFPNELLERYQEVVGEYPYADLMKHLDACESLDDLLKIKMSFEREAPKVKRTAHVFVEGDSYIVEPDKEVDPTSNRYTNKPLGKDPWTMSPTAQGRYLSDVKTRKLNRKEYNLLIDDLKDLVALGRDLEFVPPSYLVDMLKQDHPGNCPCIYCYSMWPNTYEDDSGKPRRLYPPGNQSYPVGATRIKAVWLELEADDPKSGHEDVQPRSKGNKPSSNTAEELSSDEWPETKCTYTDFSAPPQATTIPDGGKGKDKSTPDDPAPSKPTGRANGRARGGSSRRGRGGRGGTKLQSNPPKGNGKKPGSKPPDGNRQNRSKSGGQKPAAVESTNVH